MANVCRLIFLTSLAALALAACQTYAFVPAPNGVDGSVIVTGGGTFSAGGGGTSGPGGVTTVEHFTVPAVGSTDILLVIDSSGSMADKQARLAENTQQFISTLVASGNPFRIGLITTDMVDTNEQGRLHRFAPGVLYLDAPASNDPALAAKAQLLIDRFVAAVKAVGTQGDSRESALGAALNALGVSEAVDPAVVAHNVGFVRPDADLAIIIMTDEDDCSRTATSLAGSSITAWTPEQCYDATLEGQRLTASTVVQRLAQAKGGNLSRVRVGMIIAGMLGSDGKFNPISCYTDGQSPSDTCGCWSWSGSDAHIANFYCTINTTNGQPCDLAPACDSATSCLLPTNNCVTQCSAMGGYRYYATLNALSSARLAQGVSAGTALGSICDSSFAASLTDIASQVVAPSCFKLGITPDATTTYTVSIYTQGKSQPVAELNPARPGACTACGGPCSTGSFTVAGQNVCLGCGLFLQPGQRLDVSITSAAP